MDRFDAMQLFVRIVELGSFTRAAEQLGLQRATATQAIKQLEARLGVRLLQRTTRQVSATAEGLAYQQRCLAILAEVADADNAFSQSARQLKGTVRVDLSASMWRHVLAPALPAFCERHPHIGFDLSVSDRQIDLVREGVDCVLRSGVLKDSALVARRLTLQEQVTCASAAYLRRHGTPLSLDGVDGQGGLAGHRAVNYVSASTGKAVPLEFEVAISSHLQWPLCLGRRFQILAPALGALLKTFRSCPARVHRMPPPVIHGLVMTCQF